MAFGYLLGSIPFGLILTRLAGLGDVRDIGSGNIGATNVLRTGNKKLAALTLLLDALKGTAAVLIGARFGAGCGDPCRPRRLPRPSLSGLARLPGRQGRRDLYRRAARAVLAGGDRLLRDLAGRRARHPLLIARGARGECRCPLPACLDRRRRGSRCCSWSSPCFSIGATPTISDACCGGEEGRIGAKKT